MASEIDLSKIVKDEVNKYLNDSMSWGEKFESLKNVSGICATPEISFLHIARETYLTILDLMKDIDTQSAEMSYCLASLENYFDYLETRNSETT